MVAVSSFACQNSNTANVSPSYPLPFYVQESMPYLDVYLARVALKKATFYDHRTVPETESGEILAR